MRLVLQPADPPEDSAPEQLVVSRGVPGATNDRHDVGERFHVVFACAVPLPKKVSTFHDP